MQPTALRSQQCLAATAKRFEILDCGGSGDLAWALARFSEAETGTGTTLAVFERHGQAGWLIRVSSLNEGDDNEGDH